ncbi:MAG: MSMEG_0570 family nitrogen starvation response protein [Candidatus Velthaea sp.]
MPEIRFVVRWPDDTVTRCYSPSLVVTELLEIGPVYALDEFVERSRRALTIASERVEAKYGFACSRALAQLAEIESTARRFRAGCIRIEGFEQ